VQESFAAALNLWQKTGIPENPRPWLISTARFKAIDAMGGGRASTPRYRTSSCISKRNRRRNPRTGKRLRMIGCAGSLLAVILSCRRKRTWRSPRARYAG
jgi:predicted RNA polymerase sigma factor